MNRLVEQLLCVARLDSVATLMAKTLGTPGSVSTRRVSR